MRGKACCSHGSEGDEMESRCEVETGDAQSGDVQRDCPGVDVDKGCLVSCTRRPELECLFQHVLVCDLC